MAEDKYLAALKESIVKLDFAAVVKAAQEAMDAGVDPRTAITDGMVPGMAIIGDKFESGEYYLSELVVAGEVMRQGLEIINPHLKGGEFRRPEKVVIATVEGDRHDLGKNVVTTLLRAQGFEVFDLGVDVSSAKILDSVKAHKPAIVGLSALLSLTMAKMGEVIQVLKEAGLREKVKVIVGGTPVTPEFAELIGVDHRADNALEGAKKCVEWVTPQGGNN